MNERMRELSLAAGGSHYPDINPELQQRFAELIVRECAGLCSITASGRDVEAIEAAILKHFGVKE